MRVLSIGNSFSQDAQRYIHRLAKKEGADITVANLFIGGCPLRTHYLNMLGDKYAYTLAFNGQSTDFKVSIRQALESGEWDVITLQQASKKSVDKKTFSPYIEELANYVRKYCPHSKIYIHETWAYEEGSDALNNVMGYAHAEDMFKDVKESYEYAAKLIKADRIIHSGTAMLKAASTGDFKIHRDTCHAGLGTGRYLLALTWYKTLTGGDISNNDFNELDEPITDEQRKIIIDAVNYAVK